MKFVMYLIQILAFIASVQGHASRMVTDKCSKSMAVGTDLMGSSSVTDTTNRIVVTRTVGGVPQTLTSGAQYTPGETLVVSLASTNCEYVFEVTKAAFVNGKCTGAKRFADGPATLTMPVAGSGVVTIIAGWAKSESTVKMTTPFTLVEGGATVKPTAKPTCAPTRVPTAKPTAAPTITPTAAPSAAPSTRAPTVGITAPPTFGANVPTPDPTTAPTAAPSSNPTQAPSAAPTHLPTTDPSAGPTEQPTQAPNNAAMTSAPTTATLTLVSIQAVQALSNISALTLTGNEEAGGALTGTMKSTLTQAMSHFGIPLYVNITSVDAAPAPEATHLRQLAAAPPQVSVSYIIAYYLESTQYSTPSELEGSVNIALSVIMDSQMFLNELRTHNVPALAGITTASLLSTSVANVALLRSPAPTPAPTTIPDTDDAYHAPNAAKLSAGLLVGFFGALAIGVSVYIYVTAPESSLGGVKYVMTNLPLVSCLATAAVAVVLVSVWASDSGGDNDFGFLQVPSWSRNVFAYHPVFMVLYFALQVQALTNWSIFSVKLNAKHAHVLVQLASAATMIAALVAVVKYMGENKSPSLVSVHSWIGAAAAAVFGFNFLWGSTMSYLTVYHPGSPLRARLPLLLSHKFLGIAALLLAALAVNTGIMEQLPRGTCSYHLRELDKPYEFDTDPAENYRYIPLSCKIANGLGIAVIVSALCALLTVLVRAQGGAPAPAPAGTSAVQPAGKEEVHHVEESGVDADGYTAVISAE